MATNDVTVVLVHGAWAHGSSWTKVIAPLAASGVKAVAAPLPLTSFHDDVAALDRTLERAQAPIVLVGHVYAGAIIGATRSDKVKALVYVAAFGPDEGETVADVFYRGAPHPQAPKLAPDTYGLIYLPEAAFAAAFAQNASKEELAVLTAVQRPISPARINVRLERPLWTDRPSWFLVAEQDRMIVEDNHRFMAERMGALPGFGKSDMPDKANTFDQIAETLDRFTEIIGFDRYAIYVFDYGAPTGFRLAVKHPERITAIISQNGNAYEEGLGGGWNPIQAYWKDPSQANREALRSFLKPETTAWQYTHGVPDPTRVSPDGYSLDSFYMLRPGMADVQLDLMGDYQSNVALYPTFQRYFRTHKPPLLAAWGKNDPFFLPPGAEAFKRDIPNATVRFFDTGHFALETHAPEIAAAILEFFPR